MAKMIYKFLENSYKKYIEDWCNSRGLKVEDWNYETGFNGESFVTFKEFCENEFKDEDMMKVILSEDEFTFWKAIQNENVSINTYKLPVTWEVYSTVEIEATSLEEAVEIFKETKDDIVLPTDSDYVDDSFKLSDTDLNYLKMFN